MCEGEFFCRGLKGFKLGSEADGGGEEQHMYVAHVFYAAAGAFTKLSILTSYLRIFSGKVLRWILYGTAVVVTVMGVCAIFATVFDGGVVGFS